MKTQVKALGHPSRNPGTFSVSAQLRGFPESSSIGMEAERREQPSPASGLWSQGPNQGFLGPGGILGKNRDLVHSQLRDWRATRVPRATRSGQLKPLFGLRMSS